MGLAAEGAAPRERAQSEAGTPPGIRAGRILAGPGGQLLSADIRCRRGQGEWSRSCAGDAPIVRSERRQGNGATWEDKPGTSTPGHGRCRAGTTYPVDVSVAEDPNESSQLTVVTPGDALERAQPLPSDDDMAVDGLTDEEWNAFEHALADQ